MNDHFWPFSECWDGWRGVRIGSPVVVYLAYTGAEGRRWPSAESKISCRLHDETVLGNWILRFNMRDAASAERVLRTAAG
jgi:hypothetical protein